MISVAPMDNTSLVCDPSWVSNALEQAERLISHTKAKKVLHNFASNLQYNKVLHTFAWNPLYFKLFNNEQCKNDKGFDEFKFLFNNLM